MAGVAVQAFGVLVPVDDAFILICGDDGGLDLRQQRGLERHLTQRVVALGHVEAHPDHERGVVQLEPPRRHVVRDRRAIGGPIVRLDFRRAVAEHPLNRVRDRDALLQEVAGIGVGQLRGGAS
ncbi:MAG: hypothetical protein U5K81_15630 [Trueperaceae bacterium]|nr:hypothetical protein [Trueperaceae bacterium]